MGAGVASVLIFPVPVEHSQLNAAVFAVFNSHGFCGLLLSEVFGRLLCRLLLSGGRSCSITFFFVTRKLFLAAGVAFFPVFHVRVKHSQSSAAVCVRTRHIECHHPTFFCIKSQKKPLNEGNSKKRR